MGITSRLACASLLLTLAGCGAGEPTATESGRRMATGVEAPTLNGYPTIDCPPGFQCEYAADQGPIDVALDTLETNCNQESCGNAGIVPGSTWVEVDATGANLADVLRGTCAATGLPFALASDATGCWDCTASCANACPRGERCVTIPRTPGSDCRRFKCPAGYTMVTETNAFIPPTCRREVPTAPPASPVVYSTATVNGNPYLAWSPVSGATSYVIHRQLEWMAEADTWGEVAGPDYTDYSTTVSGPPGGWGTKWVAYYIVAKNAAGVSGPSQTFYWPYTGIVPY